VMVHFLICSEWPLIRRINSCPSTDFSLSIRWDAEFGDFPNHLQE
jgi:hypothetical protein